MFYNLIHSILNLCLLKSEYLIMMQNLVTSIISWVSSCFQNFVFVSIKPCFYFCVVDLKFNGTKKTRNRKHESEILNVHYVRVCTVIY